MSPAPPGVEARYVDGATGPLDTGISVRRGAPPGRLDSRVAFMTGRDRDVVAIRGITLAGPTSTSETTILEAAPSASFRPGVTGESD